MNRNHKLRISFSLTCDPQDGLEVFLRFFFVLSPEKSSHLFQHVCQSTILSRDLIIISDAKSLLPKKDLCKIYFSTKLLKIQLKQTKAGPYCQMSIFGALGWCSVVLLVLLREWRMAQ